MQKHAQTNLHYVVWREICLCISPQCSSTATISTGRKPGIWVWREQQRSQFGPPRNKDPCVYCSHRVPRVSPTQTHTGTDIKSTLWKCFTVKWPFSWRANGGWFSTDWCWVPQMTLVVMYRVAQPKTIFSSCSCCTGLSGVEPIICPSISFCLSHILQSFLRRKLKQATFKSNFVFLR